MRDLARLVDRSPMTVSRALRGDETVSKQTRALIQKTAEELGYVYDSTALAFRTQKSGFVAVTLPSINNANFAETFQSLSDGLESNSIQLLLGSTNYQIEKEQQLVRQLLARKPEAIVVTGSNHTAPARGMLQNARIPVIQMWDLPQEPIGHVVGFSNQDAMAQMVKHLAAQGRRKLAFVGATAGHDLRGSARRDGVVATARALGLPDVAQIDAGPAPVSMRDGSAAIAALGRDVLRYDALVCVSDPVAFGVLNECKRLGFDVPGDIAVTGFGNFEVSEVSSPRITTVGVHADAIGRKVAELLCTIFSEPQPPQWIDVGSKLIVRETA